MDVVLIGPESLTSHIRRQASEYDRHLSLVDIFDSAESALSQDSGGTPDVFFLAVALPGVSGIDALHLLRRRWPSAGFVVVDDKPSEARVVEAVLAGASGYISMASARESFYAHALAANRGEFPTSPDVAAVLAARVRRDAPASRSRLTVRELSVLTLLAKGLSYKQIADSLKLSINTVRNYVRNIYEKVGARSKNEAIERVLR